MEYQSTNLIVTSSFHGRFIIDRALIVEPERLRQPINTIACPHLTVLQAFLDASVGSQQDASLLTWMAMGLVIATLPPRRSETIRIGIEPWVGFSPLVVADQLGLCEGVLEKDAVKIQRIIAGWMRAVELLRAGDPHAIDIACNFLGDAGQPITPEQYYQMADGMRYGSVRENLAFFRRDANGSNEFQRRMQTAQQRWDRHHQLRRQTDPAEGDGSHLFLEIYAGGR